jgi:hypothetical protein
LSKDVAKANTELYRKDRKAHWLKINGRPQPLDEMVSVQQLLDK